MSKERRSGARKQLAVAAGRVRAGQEVDRPRVCRVTNRHVPVLHLHHATLLGGQVLHRHRVDAWEIRVTPDAPLIASVSVRMTSTVGAIAAWKAASLSSGSAAPEDEALVMDLGVPGGSRLDGPQQTAPPCWSGETF